MGYESRIHVIHRLEAESPRGTRLVWGDEVARFDLCKMGYEYVDGVSFPELFKTPIDFNLYNTNSYDDPDVDYPDSHYREDCYGKHCCYSDIGTVLAWLEKSEVLREWWRAKLFYDFLISLMTNDAENLLLVHYGY